MVITPEAKVKKVVVKQLKLLGAYYFYPVTGGYGMSGVPDIVGCYKGTFFGIECKAGSNAPTALQRKNFKSMERLAQKYGKKQEKTEKNYVLTS
jgi:Holliday junction resolvase